MQITEVDRQTTRSGEMVAVFKAGKRSIQLIGTFEDRATLDELLYSIACRKIAERFMQRRDNIVLTGGNGIIEVGK